LSRLKTSLGLSRLKTSLEASLGFVPAEISLSLSWPVKLRWVCPGWILAGFAPAENLAGLVPAETSLVLSSLKLRWVCPGWIELLHAEVELYARSQCAL
jgi:hypothetical protein